MTVTLTVRPLSTADLQLAHGIDVSEEGQVVYRYRHGVLSATAQVWRRPLWDAAEWEHAIARWSDLLKWDVVLGAFDSAHLVGMASLRYRLTETTAQVVSLHVSRAYRRRGVATRLLQELVRLAQQSGAEDLYVSATESESAVRFYTRHGFRPTERIHAFLYDLEPEDIHMTRPL